MSESLVRGNWDGSDEEIEMTTKEYYERFIWDQNYGEAPEIFVGDKIVNRGNTLVNL
ncbi:MAG: hypothetical protein LBH96_02865 [Candidatus Peribacteria bacterium]|nr:hypothetical protein [Candidatus Peribacteria bacterium]